MTEPKYTPEFLKEVKTLLDTPIENWSKIVEQYINLLTNFDDEIRRGWADLGVSTHMVAASHLEGKREKPPAKPWWPRKRPEVPYDEYVEKTQQKKDK
jgi:hypothetical protein